MHFYDPLYGRIDIPQQLEAVANGTHFRRLHHLRQLGLCYLSFPGGNHTRFEHSLGAFHLATTVAGAIRRSQVASQDDRDRLAWLARAAALCHDIGHGPFSHMSENVLNALGVKVTHEEVGAAIICGPLADSLSPLGEFGVAPELIGSAITKTPHGDPVVACATALVASDLDVDRLDYLHRDAHYAGILSSGRLSLSELGDVWEFGQVGSQYCVELTPAGVRFAEHILFLRRNSYERIVFDSKHLSATGMFEKALFSAFHSDSRLGELLQSLVGKRLDWKEPRQEDLQHLLQIYGMVDFEALDGLEQSCREARYLIKRIRRGRLYDEIATWQWSDIHHLCRAHLSRATSGDLTFRLCRRVENWLAEHADVAPRHIVAVVPAFRPPSPLLFGVTGGATLGDVTELGAFLQGDYLRRYRAGVFVDQQVDQGAKQKLADEARKLFVRGKLFQLLVNQ